MAKAFDGPLKAQPRKRRRQPSSRPSSSTKNAPLNNLISPYWEHPFFPRSISTRKTGHITLLQQITKHPGGAGAEMWAPRLRHRGRPPHRLTQQSQRFDDRSCTRRFPKTAAPRKFRLVTCCKLPCASKIWLDHRFQKQKIRRLYSSVFRARLRHAYWCRQVDGQDCLNSLEVAHLDRGRRCTSDAQRNRGQDGIAFGSVPI